MNEYQKKFLSHVASVQDTAVQVTMSQYNKGDDIEDLLYDVTGEVIVRMMSMLDGCSEFSTDKMDIVNKKTGVCLKKDPSIELHDAVCPFLKFEKS